MAKSAEPIEVEVEETEEGKDVNLEEGGEEEVVDPGTNEGMGKNLQKRVDENGDPNEDHPRFKEVYAKWKESDRRIDELIASGQDRDKLIEAMKEHNANIVSAIEKQTEATKKNTETKETSLEDEAVKVFDDTLKGLKAEKVRALEEGDYVKADSLRDNIDEIKEQKREALSKKTEKKAETSATITEEQQKIINEWSNTTDWYNKDMAMTHAAYAIESEVFNSPEFKDKPYDEVLEEVKKRTESRFHYSGNGEVKEEKKAPPPSVEGAGGITGNGDGGTKIKLTKEQVKVAHGFGMTPEEYAKQLNIIQ